MEDAQLRLVETVDDAQQLMNWLGERRTWLGVDTETGGLEWWEKRLRTIQLGDANTGWVIPFERWGGVAVEALDKYEGPMVAHHAKFDQHFLHQNGVNLKRHLLHDSMFMVGLNEPLLRKDLKGAAARHVSRAALSGARLLNQEFARNKWDWDTIPIDNEVYWTYAALDPVITARLAEKMYPLMHTKRLMEAYNVEMALSNVLVDMETQGLLIDIPYVKETKAWLEQWEEYLLGWLVDVTGLKNPNSDKQVVNWFQSRGHVFTDYTPKGNVSLSADVLEGLGSEWGDMPSMLLNYRRKSKLRATYFDAFLRYSDDEGALHTQINQMKARTARMSSEKPNLQNVPSRTGPLVRNAFIAREGMTIVAADFDQIEYRIMVCRAGEQVLIDAITRGEDLHTFMAAVVHNTSPEQITKAQRSVMKNANFGFLYGAGDAKFALMAGITAQEATYFRALYQERFPNITSYTRSIQEQIERYGVVHTPYLGRDQSIEDRKESYKAINYVTQGEAGDVLKKKMVDLSNTAVGPYMRLPIHDEILFEVPDEFVDDAVSIIKSTMPENEAFDVPLSIGVQTTKRWGDLYA